MVANKEFSCLCEEWYESAQGAFVLESRLRLTKQMISPWPRRGHSVLEMGCAHWKSLELLWESGFDVSAVAATALHKDMALHAMSGKIEISHAALDHLSYADNSFDYVCLMLPPYAKNTLPTTKDLLQECVRIASKGILIEVWNPISNTGILRTCGKLKPFLQYSPWATWRSITRPLKKLCPEGRLRIGSILHTPPTLWQKGALLRKINTTKLPFPLGALMQIRFDLKPGIPLTGIPLRFDTLQSKAVMEPVDTLSTAKRIKETPANNMEIKP